MPVHRVPPPAAPRRSLAARAAPAALVLCVLTGSRFLAEERIDADVNARIRDEGLSRSRVMETIQVLTDHYGPRVTGSPALEAAGRWAVSRMESWGLVNGQLEPWDFGRAGWSNELAWGAIVSPMRDMLTFEVLAWTPGTDGPVTGPVVHLTPPDAPTEAELDAYLAPFKERLKGAMVLVGRPRAVPVQFEAPAKRRPDADVRAQYDRNRAPEARAPAERRPGGGTAARRGALSASQVSSRIEQRLVEQRAAVRILDAGLPHGQIAAFAHRAYDPARTLPAVVLRNEDYGRLARLAASATPVSVQFHIVNRTHPEGATAFNAIAEIPGGDRREEVVMLGGHLDSWHAATGATDNAVGCAVMMEAVRILRAIGVQPRRTIRVALWSGEEQGLLGSQAYVGRHFGSFEEPRPDFERLIAYLNMDGGTGRARGALVFGPRETAAAVADLLAPFEDFGVLGAAATASRATGGTDHTSFNNAGLIGINFQQDPIEYRTHTHHTNLDTYERIVEEDVKRTAIVAASLVYHLAMRDEPLPRFTGAAMPAPRPRAGGNR